MELLIVATWADITVFNSKQRVKITLTPNTMFFPESKPAANIRAVYGGFLSTIILQANLDIVLCETVDFSFL